MTKRIISLLTTLVMAISLAGVLPAVDAAAETYSGKCGDNVNWSLDTSTGILTISGTGDTYDYSANAGGGQGRPSIAYSSDVPWYNYNEYITQVEIKSGVTSIGDCFFGGCENLKNIKIPNSIINIGKNSFENCDSLTSITIPKSVVNIKNEAFAYCNLTSVTIPNSVKYIGNHAFVYCYNLKNITISNSVISIGEGAFRDCKKLTSVTIPKNVTEIGDYAFGFYLNSYWYNDFGSEIKEIVKFNNFKICCYASTAGEKYAKDNGFEYEILVDIASNITNKSNATKASKTKINTVNKPAKVKSVKLTAKKKKLNVKWKKVSGATGYEVMYAKNNKFTKGKKTVKVKKNKVTLKRLKSKKKYFVKVRAYKTVNGNKCYGKWSKVVKKKVK